MGLASAGRFQVRICFINRVWSIIKWVVVYYIETYNNNWIIFGREKMANEVMRNVLEKYPWIKKEKQKLIISPDSDGFLSSLLLMNYFGAEVVGYYDCKVMLCKKGIDPRDCIFVDLDIFCKDIRSVGHHMVCYNHDRKPNNWYNYDNCIQLNNLRDFDCKHNFQQKYPFATIHFLLSLLEGEKKIDLAPEAIVPLLFSDGVCNNLFGYPENCLEWFHWLGANDESSLLYGIFYKEIPFSIVMKHMNTFFRARDSYNASCYYDCNFGREIEKKRSRSGHHMIISSSDGTPVNIVKNSDGTFDIFDKEKERTIGFISMMSSYMGWDPMRDKWAFDDLELYTFKKESLGGGSSSMRLNQGSYKAMVEKDCFSMAITAGSTIEYTRDVKGYFRTVGN